MKNHLNFLSVSAIVLGLSSAFGVPSARAFDLYLSPSGHDDVGYDCRNVGDPCKTIEYAVAVINNNGYITNPTIHLAAGAYSSPPISAHSLTKTTTIVGAGVGVSFVHDPFSVSGAPSSTRQLFLRELTYSGHLTVRFDGVGNFHSAHITDYAEVEAENGRVLIVDTLVDGSAHVRSDFDVFVANTTFAEQSDLYVDIGKTADLSETQFEDEATLTNHGTLYMSTGGFRDEAAFENSDSAELVYPVFEDESYLLNYSGSVFSIWRGAFQGSAHIENRDEATISETTFTDTAWLTNQGDLAIEQSTFTNMLDVPFGYIQNNGGYVLISQCEITGNVPSHILRNASGGVIVRDTEISNNVRYVTSTPFIENRGSLGFENSVVSDNSIGAAPIIYSDEGHLRIEDSVFDSNFCEGIGCAVFSFGASPNVNPPELKILRSAFYGNHAREGAAVYTDKDVDLHIEQTTFYGHQAFDHGGALVLRGGTQALILDSTVAENECFDEEGGGGIYIADPGTVIAINQSTIANNRSDKNGAGISVYGEARIKLRSVTIANNVAFGGSGAGIYGDSSSTFDTESTIFADNKITNVASTSNCDGVTSQSLGYNLDTDGTCRLSTGSDIVNSQSGLGTLGDHGGPTMTIDLTGGPAVDAANPSGCYGEGPGNNSTFALDFDQRGTGSTRHFDAGSGSRRCDIGAFEVHFPVWTGG